MALNPDIEASVIQGCTKGDRSSQYTLYNGYKTYLYGICMRYARNADEAADMLQEGFYLILRDIGKFTGNSALKTWMSRVMVNSCLMHIRKFRKIQFSTLETDQLERIDCSEDVFSKKDRADAIIHLIRKLPTSYQTVFNMRAMEGYSFREISEQLNQNEATLRSHYLRARQQLQNFLAKEFKGNE